MSRTPILDRLRDNEMEKTAVVPFLGSALSAMGEAVGTATGMHVGQNALLKGLINRPWFGRQLGSSFQRGVSGTPMSKATSFVGGLLGGSVLPEAHALGAHAHEVGGAVNRGLRARGVKELTPRDMVLARAISEGNFSKLLQSPRYHMTPAFNSLMQVAEKQSGLPIRSYMSKALYGGSSAEKEKALAVLKNVETTWKDPKKSPFTANILANLTRGGGGKGKLGPIPINTPSSNVGANLAHMAGTAIGAGGMAAAGEPVMAGLNVAKSLATNATTREAINQTGLGTKALGWLNKKFYSEPVAERFKSTFLHGNSPEVPAARQLLNTYGGNALSSSIAQSAGHLGHAAGQGVPKSLRRNVSDYVLANKKAS